MSTLLHYGAYEITVTARANCRRMILRWDPNRRLLMMSVPTYARRTDVLRFLEGQKAWLAEHASSPDRWRPAWVAGEHHRLLGTYVTLGEDGVPCGERAFAQYRAEKLTAVLRRLLPLWEGRMGVHASGLRLKEMTTRWGSCQTRTHVITLNLRLAAAPEECVAYVLVHELCHLLHPDHSPAFHGEMTRLMPKWPVYRKQLNDFDMTPRPPV